jgi:hypothetical protein
MGFYSKKYLATILGVLVAIAAAVFGFWQLVISHDEPEADVWGPPDVGVGPTGPPHVGAPTTPPPAR